MIRAELYSGYGAVTLEIWLHIPPLRSEHSAVPFLNSVSIFVHGSRASRVA